MRRTRLFSTGSPAISILAAVLAGGLLCAACDAHGSDARGEFAGEAAPGGGGPDDAQALISRLLPLTGQDGITFAQVTDKRPLDLSRSGGRVGFVWGGDGISGQAPGSRYFPQDRDPDRSHSADWYARQAPDQIAYKCDRKSPAPVFTYAWGAYSPIDTTNPAVRQAVLQRYLLPAIRSGTRVIALDNVSLLNGGKRCGVYRHGQWVQLFSGEERDPAYAAAVLDWVGWLARQIHANGGLLALNAKVDPNDEEDTRKLIGLADIWLDEAAFTRDCNPRVSDRAWRVKMEIAQWAAERMPWVSLEKTCASGGDIPPEEAQWVVGNFLLAEGRRSYLGAVHDGDPTPLVLHYPAWLNPPVGAPQGPAFAIPGGGMARRFTRGLVVVNPSSTSQLAYVLPFGNWTRIGGGATEGKVVLGPTSAAILLMHQ